MARGCTICDHPKRAKIDDAIREALVSKAEIGRRFKVSARAVGRHESSGHGPEMSASTGSQPALRIAMMRPDELSPNPLNFRVHPPEQAAALEGQMRELDRLDDGDSSGHWAGVAGIFNERTGRLIDGHLREGVPADLLDGEGRMPIMVGRWTEAQEFVILRSFDAIGAMATEDRDKTAELMEALRDADAEAAELMEGMVEAFDVLPDFGDVEEVEFPETHADDTGVRVMSFALLPEQFEDVEAALGRAKSAGAFDGENTNANGNALHRLAVSYG